MNKTEIEDKRFSG